MGRSNETFGKRDVRAKNERKRKEKEQKRLERKQLSRNGNILAEMIAYVDENGKITSTPPDLTQKKDIKAEDIEIGVPKNTLNANETIRKGVVIFYDESKGFGFIKDTSTGRDIFVHAKALTEPLHENNKVTFEITKGPKGFNAINIVIEKE